jgi:hypothetical protein
VDWTVETGISFGANAAPAVLKDRAYLASGASLFAFETASGRQVLSAALPEALATGKAILQTARGILVPHAASISLIDASSGALLRSIAIPQGLALGPLAPSSAAATTGPARQDRLVYLRRDGFLAFRSLVADGPEEGFDTGFPLDEPLGLAEAGDAFLISDARGWLGLYRASPGSGEARVWLRQLAPLLSAPEYGSQAIAAATTSGILVLDPETGAELGKIPKAAGPLLLSQGRLYAATTDGRLVIARAKPFAIERSVLLPAPASARPLMLGGSLWVGLKDGSLLWLDAAAP